MEVFMPLLRFVGKSVSVQSQSKEIDLKGHR